MSHISRVQIGSSVSCDGNACGTVLRIVIDPAARLLTHLAVGPRRGGGRLVPLSAIGSAGERVELNCTKAQFDAFLPDQDQALISSSDEVFARNTPPYSSGMVGALTVFGEIAPTGVVRPLPNADMGPETETFDRVPDGQEELKPSERVKAQDGSVGHVSGVGVELDTGHLSHMVVESGRLWGKHQIAIPIESVEHIGISVKIALTKQQIGELKGS